MESIHGCALNIYNTGVLITGESSTGKSELALQLVDRGHKFIADDLVVVDKNNDTEVIISAAKGSFSFLHVRGLGFINISKLYGMFNIVTSCKLDLIINLINDDQNNTYLKAGSINPLTQLISEVDILGIPIAQMDLLINHNRPLALLVEIMVKYNNHRQSGYDSHQDFLSNHAELCNSPL